MEIVASGGQQVAHIGGVVGGAVGLFGQVVGGVSELARAVAYGIRSLDGDAVGVLGRRLDRRPDPFGLFERLRGHTLHLRHAVAEQLGGFANVVGGVFGDAGQLFGAAAKDFHVFLDPGRGALGRQAEIVGVAVQRLANLSGLLGGALGRRDQVLALAAQGLGDRVGADVGVLGDLLQLLGLFAHPLVGGFGARDGEFGRPGQLLGLAPQRVGNLGHPAHGRVGRIDKLLQMPTQHLAFAFQGAAALEMRHHHPDQRQRRQRPGRDPAQLVGQKLQEVGPAELLLDGPADGEQPRAAQRRSRHDGKAPPDPERRAVFFR